MGAPDYVATTLAQQPRRGLPLPPARRWMPGLRPGDPGSVPPDGPGFGKPGPDQGYGLVLAERLVPRLELAPAERVEDAVAGCLQVGLRRASIFSRAPIIHDMTLAFTLWGYLGEAPPELIEHRFPLFQSAAHHYWDQRAIADAVPEETLRMSLDEVQHQFPDLWTELLGL